MSAGLFYIFCDEKYLDIPGGGKQIITGYFTVPQNSWSQMCSDRQTLKVPENISRMERIKKILDTTSGVATVAHAALNMQLLQQGERNGTNDVSNMARNDNVWGAAMAYGLAATLGHMGSHKLQVQNIDLYYDTRDLKQAHQSGLEKVVTQTLRGIIREGHQKGLTPSWFQAEVHHFQPVYKPAKGVAHDKFQAGVLVIHYLLQNAKTLIQSGGTQRIHVIDNTQVVKKYIENFSYHGNIRRHVFHQPDCRYYNCKDCTEVFYSRKEAIRAGYKPCKVCKL